MNQGSEYHIGTLMGRIGSAYSIIQAILIITVTSIMGVAAQITSIQAVVFFGVLVMLVLSIMLCVFSLLPSKKQFYEAESNRSISL